MHPIADSNTASEKPLCASCGAKMKGKFCHKCGEKTLKPERDFSIPAFLKDSFERVTHLDSRLLRSFGLLFARPGFLTTEFMAGRRVHYLKPLPLLAISAVLFYFFFPTATAFFSNLGDMNMGYRQGNLLSNTFRVDTESLFSQKFAASGWGEAETYWKVLSEEASRRSKAWLFVIVPVWGSLIWCFLRRRNRWLIPHWIFALHNLTFFILFDVLALLICKYLLGLSSLGEDYSLLLLLSFTIYNILAVRRVYGFSQVWAIVSGTVITLLFLLLLLLYRQVMTIGVLVY